MFNKTKSLIVVYKDEMLVNQLKKLVETKDDISEDEIIGTRDDSVKIVPWTEKVWLDNKKKGTIDSKILFLGDIKGVDKLIPVLDLKFDEYGVRYGWAGDQAVLYVDGKALNNRDKYVEFLDKISTMPVPEMIKNANKKLLEEAERTDKTDETESIHADSKSDKSISEEKKNFIDAALDSYVHGVTAMQLFFKKAGSDAIDLAGDFFKDKTLITRQQMFYGVLKLYNGDLESFMQG